jgi:hypothetical protein
MASPTLKVNSSQPELLQISQLNPESSSNVRFSVRNKSATVIDTQSSDAHDQLVSNGYQSAKNGTITSINRLNVASASVNRLGNRAINSAEPDRLLEAKSKATNTAAGVVSKHGLYSTNRLSNSSSTSLFMPYVSNSINFISRSQEERAACPDKLILER